MDVLPTLFAQGADPWVLRHTDGRFYASASQDGALTLRRAATLAGLRDAPAVTLWTPPPGTDHSHELWAPEVHVVDGRWVLYVAADDGDNANHRMFALENPAADPLTGVWTLHGPLDTHGWAIDGTRLHWQGRSYFVWSGWEGTDNVAQHLFIAPLKDPFTIDGPRVRISSPDHDWETRGSGGPDALPTINEGPQVLIRGERVHIIYSASGSWSDFYCLGRLTLAPGGDPTDPTAWHKHPAPAFESGNGIVAPGHASFVREDPGADWIVYHAARHPGAGWDRFVRAQTFVWDADDAPIFGVPAKSP
jgi:GH43 family beta-xylosidase